MCRLHLAAFSTAESASVSEAEGRLPPILGNLRVTRQIQKALRQILCQLVEARLRGELVFWLLD
jgi:hypothetical protein